jgi:amino acid transporter
LFFALGRAGLAPRFGTVHPLYRTPATAIVVCAILALAGVLICAEFAGAADSAAWLTTIGTLALILIYIGVTAAEIVVSVAARRTIRALLGGTGTLALLWLLYNSI